MSQWIPFTLETFTEVNKDMLFLTSSGPVVGQIRPDSVNKKISGGTVGPTAEDVTHWAPLPHGMIGTAVDGVDRAKVSAAVLKLAGLLNDPHPGLATWNIACETAYQELLTATASVTSLDTVNLQAEVAMLRELVKFPSGPFDDAQSALESCAELLARLAEAHAP